MKSFNELKDKLMKKNYLLSGIAIFLFMLCGTSSAFAASWHYPTETTQELPYEEGMGTKENPYIINNAQQLALLSWNVNKRGTTFEGCYFTLGNDIDLNPGFTFGKDGSVNGEGTPQQWVPIGATGVFKGNFDGKGHTIKGMYQDSLVLKPQLYSGYNSWMGLFGKTSKDTLCNVSIKNSLISIDSKKIGGIVYIGALAGEVESGVIWGCSNKTTINVLYQGDNTELGVGGLIGMCSSLPSTTRTCKIWDCANLADITVQSTDNYQNSHIAGICGEMYEVESIENCSNSGNITGDGSCGGIVCTVWYVHYSEDVPSTLRNLVNTGDIKGVQTLGGIMAEGAPGCSFTIVEKCVNRGKISLVNTSGNGFVGGLFGQLLCRYLENCHNEGDVDGGSGIVDYTYATHVYNCSNSGNIKNGCGLIGGSMYITDIKDCSNIGEVSGYAGLIGSINGDGTDGDLNIKNCYNLGKVFGGAGLLGTVAHQKAYFSHCYNEGDIYNVGSDSKLEDEKVNYTAGFLSSAGYGSTKVYIDSCYNKGNITARGNAAGFVGNEYCVSVRNSYNAGSISGSYSAAGLSARGVVELKNSYNVGDIQSENNAAGLANGFGYSDEIDVVEISNAYNAGNVTAGGKASGLINVELAIMPNSLNITNVFNYGKLGALENSEVGHMYPIMDILYKDDNRKVSHCYYVEQESLASYSSDVFGKMSASDFASGKVCVLLNEGQDPMPWGQTVGTDPYPLLNGKGNPETGIAPVIYSGKGKTVGIYDLGGKKVNAPVAKGIYVKDGKKLVLGK